MAEPQKKSNRRKTRPGQNGDRPQVEASDTMKAGYAKSEVKNQKVRESLLPLTDGQRPTVLTVGAVFGATVATIFWVSSMVALLTDTKVDGVEPNVGQLVSTAVVMSLLAWGLWKSRYWAALGFQMLLVLLMLAAIAGLVVAGTLIQMISTTILLVGLGLLFFYMVKAMARIQMPERPTPRR